MGNEQQYKVMLIEDIDALRKVDHIWKEFHETAKGKSPFNSYDWVLSWLIAYNHRTNLFVCIVLIEGTVVAIIPCLLRNKWNLRVLEFISSDRSDYLDFLTKSDEIIIDILDILNYYRDRWDYIYFRNLYWSEDRRKVIEKQMLASGFNYMKRIYTQSPYLKIRGSWQEYLAGKGNKFAKKLRKKENRLIRKGNIEVKKEQDYNSSDQRIGNILKTAKAIEKKSWKYLEGNPRIQTDSRSEKLYEMFIKSFLDNGWLDAWFILMDNIPIAYAFNIKLNNKIFAYNSGYHESEKHHGPGALLHINRIRDAFEHGMYEYDFLRGTEGYKLEWTETHRDIYEYCFFKKTLKSYFLCLCFMKIRWYFAASPRIKNIRYQLIILLRKIRSRIK